MKHQRDNSTVYNMDNMEFMRGVEDKYYDLAVVDPPYGVGMDRENKSMGLHKHGIWKNKKLKGYQKKDWDSSIPAPEYFIELFRISKNQIIWGGNYFDLSPNGGWVVWDKLKPDGFSMSQGELAWVSCSNRVLMFKYLWNGFQKQVPEDRFHPTQKPIALYDWIYKNYLPNGGKVIDTHLGSGSNRISAFKRGNIIFDACELDVDYFNDGNDRYDEFLMKYQPAELNPITKQGQTKLF